MVPCTVGSNPTTPAMFSHQNEKAQEYRVARMRSGNAVSQKSETVPQAVSQDEPHPAEPRSIDRPASGPCNAATMPSKTRRARRSPGPYLLLRGSTYYFRKRLRSVNNQKKCTGKFLCLSLRTNFRTEAMCRAAHLLSVLQREERKIMTNTSADDPTELICNVLGLLPDSMPH